MTNRDSHHPARGKPANASSTERVEGFIRDLAEKLRQLRDASAAAEVRGIDKACRAIDEALSEAGFGPEVATVSEGQRSSEALHGEDPQAS